MNEVLSQKVDPKEKEKRSETITIVNGLQQAPTRKFPNGKEAGEEEDQDEDDGQNQQIEVHLPHVCDPSSKEAIRRKRLRLM